MSHIGPCLIHPILRWLIGVFIGAIIACPPHPPSTAQHSAAQRSAAQHSLQSSGWIVQLDANKSVIKMQAPLA
jgi:hypothetical protein